MEQDQLAQRVEALEKELAFSKERLSARLMENDLLKLRINVLRTALSTLGTQLDQAAYEQENLSSGCQRSAQQLHLAAAAAQQAVGEQEFPFLHRSDES